MREWVDAREDISLLRVICEISRARRLAVNGASISDIHRPKFRPRWKRCERPPR